MAHLDEIKPVIEVLAGNRGGALKLEARVLDALANERLDFGKAALEPL